jgi:hypothetical protein
MVCQVRILHRFTKPLGIVLTAQMEKPGFLDPQQFFDKKTTLPSFVRGLPDFSGLGVRVRSRAG